MIGWLRTRPDHPRLADEATVARVYSRKRWTTFLSITIGYGFFYTTRLSLSVAKKPMVDAGLVDAEQLGRIGFVLYLAYAFGRLTNGFLCDRAHIGRFMGTGLLISAVLNLLFGASSEVFLFVVLWGLNGWFQSMGSAPSGNNLANWFSRRERGARYSVWSLAHNLGEGFTFVITAAIVGALGWRWGFWAPGLICLVAGFLILKLVQDRPPTYGLPTISEFAGEPEEERADARTVRTDQVTLLRNPAIWILGLASAAMYVARYGINDWFVFYLQEEKGYGLVEAGATTSLFPIVGAAGTLLAGPLSDWFSGGRRVPVTLAYGGLLILGMAMIPFAPSGWGDATAVSLCGFAIGGLLVQLGGLAAIDLAGRRAAGAAMGLVGVFSYLAAAVQNWVTGALIEGRKTMIGEEVVYDFGPVLLFWFAAAVLSFLLTASLLLRRGRL